MSKHSCHAAIKRRAIFPALASLLLAGSLSSEQASASAGGKIAVETSVAGDVAATGMEASEQRRSLADLEAEVPENPLKSAYFGEIHVHTALSLDAFIAGTRLTPDMAYRFARGEPMVVNGQRHSIVRPLDFAAVTDHAEFLGAMPTPPVVVAKGNDKPPSPKPGSLAGAENQQAWLRNYMALPSRSGTGGHPWGYTGRDTVENAWQLIVQAAVDNYVPGNFSTLVGFEWTAAADGGNLHRNILFRDVNVPAAPFTATESTDEERLWDWMEKQEAEGRRPIAIAHNSYASRGVEFDPVDSSSGAALTAAYAERRNHFERLFEVMQSKGSSEVHRTFWPKDEFADFENADSIQNYRGREFARDDFVRAALATGLVLDGSLGQNPYKLGFVGGSDNHNGTPSNVAEDNYIGSHGGADATVERRRDQAIAGWMLGADANPGAITGVWAAKNTRGDIWDALRAREVFATSGTRIQPRFFGGVGLTADNPQSLVEQGYKLGVPMGGELAGLRAAPTFTVHALKDPMGANLDRIQLIKSWIDVAGNSQERIVDVAWSGAREPDRFGRLPPVGNTVNASAASYSNEIGRAELIGSWTDDDFDPSLRALYYLRVLEIPTPRWTTYDSVNSNLPLLQGAPATIQERAWTSPIWYTP